MKDRKKRNIMIGSLCALLVFMGIGYAIISQMLTIRGVSTVAGDWNIYIDSITPNAIGTGVSVNESVGIDKISASFEANLYAPGDKVEYKVVVKNDGNIDAKLGAVNQHVTNDTEGIVKYTNTLENGYILRHGESYVFYVTTEIEESIEELPENTVRAVLDLKLNFTQYTGGGSEEEHVNPHADATVLASGDISKTENDNVEWKYYSDGALVISGDGDMLDFHWGYTFYENYGPVTDKEQARYLLLQEQIVSQILYDDDPVTNSYSNMFLNDDSTRASEEEYFFKPNYEFLTYCLKSDSYLQIKIARTFGTTIENQDDFINKMVLAGQLPNNLEEFVRSNCAKIPQITSIEFEEGSNITSISSKTFENLGYGGEISIPNTVTEIGYVAFQDNAITAINFNNTSSLTTIDNSVFAGNLLTSVVIPNSVTSIGPGAFRQNGLTNVTIPLSVTSIGYDAFVNQRDLQNQTIYPNILMLGRSDLSGMNLETRWNGKDTTDNVTFEL